MYEDQEKGTYVNYDREWLAIRVLTKDDFGKDLDKLKNDKVKNVSDPHLFIHQDKQSLPIHY